MFELLRLEALADDARLYRQVRLPLLNLDPKDDKLIPMVISIDFGLVYPDNTIRLVDAKAKKWKSPEWLRGQRSVEACYGTQVELMN